MPPSLVQSKGLISEEVESLCSSIKHKTHLKTKRFVSLLVVLKDEERGVVRFWSFDGNWKIYVAELILPLSSFFGSSGFFTEIQRKDMRLKNENL